MFTPGGGGLAVSVALPAPAGNGRSTLEEAIVLLPIVLAVLPLSLTGDDGINHHDTSDANNCRINEERKNG